MLNVIPRVDKHLGESMLVEVVSWSNTISLKSSFLWFTPHAVSCHGMCRTWFFREKQGMV